MIFLVAAVQMMIGICVGILLSMVVHACVDENMPYCPTQVKPPPPYYKQQAYLAPELKKYHECTCQVCVETRYKLKKGIKESTKTKKEITISVEEPK